MALRVGVEVRVALGVGLLVGVRVGVPVGVAVAVMLTVGVGLAVGVGLGEPGRGALGGETTTKATQLEGPKVVWATFCTPVGLAVGE